MCPSTRVMASYQGVQRGAWWVVEHRSHSGGPSVPGKCLTKCLRESGCPTECLGWCSWVSGPWAPERPKGVWIVSRHLDTLGTFSGHFVDPPDQGTRDTTPQTFHRTLNESCTGSDCRGSGLSQGFSRVGELAITGVVHRGFTHSRLSQKE